MNQEWRETFKKSLLLISKRLARTSADSQCLERKFPQLLKFSEKLAKNVEIFFPISINLEVAGLQLIVIIRSDTRAMLLFIQSAESFRKFAAEKCAGNYATAREKVLPVRSTA